MSLGYLRCFLYSSFDFYNVCEKEKIYLKHVHDYYINNKISIRIFANFFDDFFMFLFLFYFIFMYDGQSS